MKWNKKTRKCVKAFTVFSTLLTVGVSTLGFPIVTLAGTADYSANGLKYYTDYETEADALKAGEQLTTEIASEGDILLKNNGALPMAANARISVFGGRQTSVLGAGASEGAFSSESSGGVNFADELAKGGFVVNPILQDYYKNNAGSIGKEEYEFNGQVNSSLSRYNDAAIVIFSREGGEGSDASRVTSEEVDADDFEHAALYTAGGKTYKHYLMLTTSEKKMLEYVKQNFETVIIVLNTSNAMEVSQLKEDKGISAIIDIGRPGAGGLAGLVKILNGTVNPSGALVDEWMTDFTTDPTWYNFGSNNQGGGDSNPTGGSNLYYYADGTTATGKEGSTTAHDSEGYHGVDYEESIYLGYKYYETYYYDIYNGSQPIPKGYEGMSKEAAAQKWWSDNVTYPFGYGLSYTTFSFNAGGIYTDENCRTALGATVAASKFNSEVGSPAQIKTIYVPVTVKNTGSVAGKKTVQLYVAAPYTKGGIEKASVALVGFGKTDMLNPGESQTLTISINVQDMASWDYTDANKDSVIGDYELDAGIYIIRVMENSHFDCTTDVNSKTDAYDEVRFTLSETAHLKLDDFSDNELKNLFTSDDTISTNVPDNASQDADYHKISYNSVRTADLMADGASGMTLLSRSDFAGTFPKAATLADRTFKDKVLDYWGYWDTFRVDDEYEIDSSTGLENRNAIKKKATADQEIDPWYITSDQIPANWTQATGTYDENHKVVNNRTETTFPMYVSSAAQAPIKFADMVGVAYDDPRWDEFLNQLTYDELCTVVEFGGYCTVNIESVEKQESKDTDGPNNLDSTMAWTSEDILAATWNPQLAYEQGVIMGNLALLHGVQGWYAPGADMHRSPFSGRNNEYPSQDGLHGGYMIAAEVQGVQSKGVICYIKHSLLNDQETDRGTLFVWVDEQAMRESFVKQFQIILQEGSSLAAMTGYARIGGLNNTGNYNLGVGLYQEQWGTQAYFVTDGYIGWRTRTDPDIMVRTGNQLELYTTPFVEYLSGEWNAEKRMVMVGSNHDVESPTQWYWVRHAAKGILYQISGTAAQFNGYAGLKTAGSPMAPETMMPATAGVTYNSSVSVVSQLTAGSSAKYSVSSGMLPMGLSLDRNTGAISGKPMAEGMFNFSVTATIDGWVEKVSYYAMEVKSAFYMDADGDDLSALKVGENFMAKIQSDVYTADAYSKGIVYTVAEGSALPAGVVLAEDGTISGKPEQAGMYVVNVMMTATNESASANASSGGGNSITTDTAQYTLILSVAGTDGAAPAPVVTDYQENVPYIGSNGHWFVNGVDTGTAAQAEAKVVEVPASTTVSAVSQEVQEGGNYASPALVWTLFAVLLVVMVAGFAVCTVTMKKKA